MLLAPSSAGVLPSSGGHPLDERTRLNLQSQPVADNTTSTRRWVDLLSGHPDTAAQWVGGQVPQREERLKGGRSACSGGVAIGGEHDYEEFCEEYWRAILSDAAASSRQPTMYSIGLGGSYHRELFFSSPARNASVHAYDPTSELASWHRSNTPPGVEFHFAGLGKGDASDAGSSTAGIYGSIGDGAPMVSLSQMYSQNRDPSGGPDFLTVDWCAAISLR